MSVERLPSGRWRAKINDPKLGHSVSVSRILGPDFKSFETKREAKAARAKAAEILGNRPSAITVAEFAERWTTDALFRRPKESTQIHNAERIKRFVERYGSLPLHQVTDQIVGEWLAGGKNTSTVPALRAMFTDAASAKAGRLVVSNPFARLGIRKSPGNRHVEPPSEETVWKLIAAARKQAGPSYAAWLQVACFTGMRPGELDALQWDAVDLEHGRILVREQFNATTRSFTAPKNGQRRSAPLTGQAREVLVSLPRTSRFCFPSLRGGHWTASARAYHWKAVKAEAGWDKSLYLATRHFCGWYMVNVLGLPSEDCAIALGHTDGGQLIRVLYGHRDRELALDRVLRAFDSTGNVKPLKAVKDDRHTA